MTDYYGVNGTIQRARNGNEVPFGAMGGYLTVFAKDYLSVVSAVAAADRIPLGWVRSDAYLDADLSKIFFDDMGTSITLDIGADAGVPAILAALNGNTIALLADDIDVATAAGSASLLASVTTANKHKPLWEQLNMAWDPHVAIMLYATFAGNPGTGNISWKIVGS